MALLVALALCLGGYLVSERPLVAPGEAAYPLPDKVSAERFKPGSDGKWEHEGWESAYRSGPNYVRRLDSGEESELLLKRIAQNTFIVQPRSAQDGYLYGLLVFDGNTIYEYDVDCDDFSAADQQRYGFVKKDGDDCTVTSIQGLASSYLAALQAGRKASNAYVLR